MPERSELPVESAPDSDVDVWAGTPQWPVTRLAAVALTAVLGVCMGAPALVSGLHNASLGALVLPVALSTVTARVLFEANTRQRPRGLLSHVVPALGAALPSAVLMLAACVIVGVDVTGVSFAATAVLSLCALVGAGLARDLEIRVRMSLRRVFFVGSGTARRDLETELGRCRDASFVGAAMVPGLVDGPRLVDTVLSTNATALVLDVEAMRDTALVEAAAELSLKGLQVRDLVSYYESEFKKVPLAELSPTWFLFDIAAIHRRGPLRIVRRVLQVTVSLLLIALAAPFLLVAGIAIKLTSRGPVLYRQQRVGMGGAPFTMIKLRTMTVSDGPAAWAGSEAARITAVGHVLRRFRFDEIPQLWNVVRGDLALIGPRPEQVAIVERLEHEIPFYSARHAVRPGLTGWAQVNLGYGGSMDGTIAKLQRDLYYIKHATLRLDALILWLTIKTIISGRG